MIPAAAKSLKIAISPLLSETGDGLSANSFGSERAPAPTTAAPVARVPRQKERRLLNRSELLSFIFLLKSVFVFHY